MILAVFPSVNSLHLISAPTSPVGGWQNRRVLPEWRGMAKAYLGRGGPGPKLRPSRSAPVLVTWEVEKTDPTSGSPFVFLFFFESKGWPGKNSQQSHHV